MHRKHNNTMFSQNVAATHSATATQHAQMVTGNWSSQSLTEFVNFPVLSCRLVLKPIHADARVHPAEVVEPEPDFEVPNSDVNRDLGHDFSQYIPQMSSRSIKKSTSYVGSQLQDELKFMDVNGDFLSGFKIDSIFFPTNDWHGKKRIGELVINLICIQHSGIDNIDFVDFFSLCRSRQKSTILQIRFSIGKLHEQFNF